MSTTLRLVTDALLTMQRTEERKALDTGTLLYRDQVNEAIAQLGARPLDARRARIVDMYLEYFRAYVPEDFLFRNTWLDVLKGLTAKHFFAFTIPPPLHRGYRFLERPEYALSDPGLDWFNLEDIYQRLMRAIAQLVWDQVVLEAFCLVEDEWTYGREAFIDLYITSTRVVDALTACNRQFYEADGARQYSDPPEQLFRAELRRSDRMRQRLFWSRIQDPRMNVGEDEKDRFIIPVGACAGQSLTRDMLLELAIPRSVPIPAPIMVR